MKIIEYNIYQVIPFHIEFSKVYTERLVKSYDDEKAFYDYSPDENSEKKFSINTFRSYLIRDRIINFKISIFTPDSATKDDAEIIKFIHNITYSYLFSAYEISFIHPMTIDGYLSPLPDFVISDTNIDPHDNIFEDKTLTRKIIENTGSSIYHSFHELMRIDTTAPGITSNYFANKMKKNTTACRIIQNKITTIFFMLLIPIATHPGTIYIIENISSKNKTIENIANYYTQTTLTLEYVIKTSITYLLFITVIIAINISLEIRKNYFYERKKKLCLISITSITEVIDDIIKESTEKDIKHHYSSLINFKDIALDLISQPYHFFNMKNSIYAAIFTLALTTVGITVALKAIGI